MSRLLTHRSLAPAPRFTRLPTTLARWLASVNETASEAKTRGIVATPELARRALADMTARFSGPAPEIARVLDVKRDVHPEVGIRLYDPYPDKPSPALVYIHGGGHMAGSIDVYDPVIRRVAHYSGCRTVAIDYRLAPEHPYPQGLDDCAAAIRELANWLPAYGSDTGQGVIMAGDSGGGALTASLSKRASVDKSILIRGQILVYPSLDYTLSQPSVRDNGQGYLLDADKIRWYFDNYFQLADDRRQASPLFMSPVGLPPTLIFTAGFCPLRDEGYAYTEKLRQSGIPCQHVNLPDMIHAYLNIHSLTPIACERTYQTMAQWIKALEAR